MFSDASVSFSTSAFALLTRSIVASRTEGSLSQLPDFMLKDIGLDRGGIVSARRGTRAR